MQVVKYRIEPEGKKSNVNDVLNWLSVVGNIIPSLWSVSDNLPAPILDGSEKEGITF